MGTKTYLLIAIGLVTLFFNFRWSLSKRQELIQARQKEEVTSASLVFPIKRMAQASPKPMPVPVAEASPECKAFWRQATSLSLASFTSRPSPSPLAPIVLTKPMIFQQALLGMQSSSRCDSLPPKHPLTKLNELFKKECAGVAQMTQISYATDQDSLKIMGCYSALTTYRDAVVDFESTPKPLSEINDVGVLIQKFEAISKDPERVTWAGLAKLSDRMWELAPGDKSIARQALRLHYLDLTEADEMSPAKRRRLEEVLASAEQLEPRNVLLEETKINLARLDGDTSLLNKLASEYRESNPQSPLGAYYQAWAAYLNQDYEEATKLLNEASGKDPRDTRAEFALAQLKEQAGRPAQEVFIGHTP